MLITTAEMAALGSYDTSTVVNWKKRYSDFPKPKYKFGRTEVYDEAEFETWLKMHEARKQK